MIKVRFNDREDFCEVGFDRTEHVVTLTGTMQQNTSGFTTWRMDGVTQLGDFSDFTTVYRVLDDAVQYSDDGSVWVEPNYAPDEEDKPTQEKRITALEQALTAIEEGIASV